MSDAPPLSFRTTGDGTRADRAVADGTGCGRRTARQWILQGRVRADGRRVHASTSLAGGVLVEIAATVDNDETATRNTQTRIVTRGDGWLAVDKPAGVHTQAGRSGDTLAEFLGRQVGDLSAVGERPEEFGTVHRLDRDTSGVVIVATTGNRYAAARRAFGSGAVTKSYLAIVAGRLAEPVTVDFPLARRGSRVVRAGRHDRPLAASTRVRPLASSAVASLVEASSSSGAPHQIRVHLSGIGYPLFGDASYDGPPAPASSREGHLLHALRVRWPGTLDVTVAPAADFVRAWATVGRSATATD